MVRCVRAVVQPKFQPGDRVEFLSGDGRWKAGIVVPMTCVFMHDPSGQFGRPSPNVRIEVGRGVRVIRRARQCRRVT